MISLEAGRVLEREYKGENVKVKVLKNGNYSYNGKEYDNRGELIKKITKGKTAQFSTFFGLNKEGKKDKKVKKNSMRTQTQENIDCVDTTDNTIDSHIRQIVQEEIKNYFRQINS